jgi:hypothetical protein
LEAFGSIHTEEPPKPYLIGCHTQAMLYSRARIPRMNRATSESHKQLPQATKDAASQRDQAQNLARTQPKKALELAKKIAAPWYRAQALSWVARFTDANPVTVARYSAMAAEECDDSYKRSAVRAWEIAALAERGCPAEAKEALKEAVDLAKSVNPISSRSEALFLLLQAAWTIDQKSATMVGTVLESSCPPEHWRARRALRESKKLLDGHREPRPFFW